MFAYQPAALGDILLAHKSFDVLRLPLGAEEAGAADVSIVGSVNGAVDSESVGPGTS